MMHVMAFFVLTFLMWFALNPYQKVRWSRLKTWIVPGFVIVYSAVDEILQSYVGRSADVLDFLSNLVGLLAGLCILSIFSFWPALLVLSAGFIFVVSTLSQLPGLYPQYYLNYLFHFTAYGAFALIWLQYIERYTSHKPGNTAWIVFSLLLPVGLLMLIKGVSPLFGHSVNGLEIAAALVGICSAILVSAGIFGLGEKLKGPSSP